MMSYDVVPLSAIGGALCPWDTVLYQSLERAIDESFYPCDQLCPITVNKEMPVISIPFLTLTVCEERRADQQ